MSDAAESSLFSWTATPPADTNTTNTAVEETPLDNEEVVDPSEESGHDADDSDAGEGAEAGENEESGEKKSEEPKVDPRSPEALGKLRSQLTELGKTSPENAKIVAVAKDWIGRAEAYAKLGKVDDLRSMKTVVDSAGGLEGIATSQSIASSVEATDAMLAAGDPAILAQLKEDAPEGYLKLGSHYMADLAKSHPDEFADMLQPHLVSHLSGAGFERTLARLAQATTVEEYQKIANNLKTWYDQQKQEAGNRGGSDLDPERQKLEKDRQEFTKQQDTAFKSDVGNALKRHADQELGKRLQPYLKAYPNLTQRQKMDIANSLYGEMDKAISANKAGVLQMKALLAGKGRDKTKAITHGTSEITSVSDKVLQKVMAEYGLKLKAGKKTTSNANAGDKKQGSNTAQPGKPIRVTEKPARELIDYAKTSEEQLVRGEAVLKNGKIVKWR